MEYEIAWFSSVKRFVFIFDEDDPIPWLPMPSTPLPPDLVATKNVFSSFYDSIDTHNSASAPLRRVLPLLTTQFASLTAKLQAQSLLPQQQSESPSWQKQLKSVISKVEVTLCSMLLVLELPLGSRVIWL